MKIALITDCLTEFGGAERVLVALLKLYPDADVYTAFADSKILKKNFPKPNVRVLPIPQEFFSRHTSLFQALAPFLWRIFNFNNHDLVIAISGHLMSNFIRPPSGLFIQYLLCPPKNIYNLIPKTHLQRLFPYQIYLKYLYIKALRQSSCLITLSQHMQKIFTHQFKLHPHVIYPPVSPAPGGYKHKSNSYSLIVSRLDNSKFIELAIQACNQLSEKLVIVGVSNDQNYEKYLHHLAGSTIRFLGFQPDEKLANLYSHAKVFIFTPQSEDFGIAPLEAMAHGVPVIAFHGGGVRETILDGKTGIFYHQRTAEALIKALEKFYSRRFQVDTLRQRAEVFSKEVFLRNFQLYVKKAMHTSHL